MADKPQKNGKESCYKTLVKQRKHLSLTMNSFKNRENIERKREVSGQNKRVGISVICGFYFELLQNDKLYLIKTRDCLASKIFLYFS